MTLDPCAPAPAGQIRLAPGADTLGPPPPRFASVFGRPVTRDRRFLAETVGLDGRAFVNCHFERCVLEVSSVDHDLIGCTLDPSTTVRCSAAVGDIVRWLSPGFPWANQNLPAFFVPLQRRDGAVTLWFLGRFI